MNYTATPLAPVMIAGTLYAVEIVEVEGCEPSALLTGPRGAGYVLVGGSAKGEKDAIYEVVSWKSGPKRDRTGNTIRVMWVGDIIEQIA